MNTVSFFGASDDLFVVDGDYTDEICDTKGGPMSYRIETPDGEGLVVVGTYAPSDGAVWAIGICQLDEDRPLPPWTMRWTTYHSGYSIELELELPDDAVIRRSE